MTLLRLLLFLPGCLLLPLGLLPGAAAARAQTSPVETVQPDAAAADNGGNVRRAGEGGEGVFCAQLWLVGERGFFAAAARESTFALVPVRTASRGRTFYTAIFFGGSAPDPHGAVSIAYDLTVRRPDGTLYGEAKDLVGCQGPLTARAAPASPEPSSSPSPAAPAAAPALQLGRDYLGILIGARDPAGTYTVEAVVRDRVGRAELTLKTTFTVL